MVKKPIFCSYIFDNFEKHSFKVEELSHETELICSLIKSKTFSGDWIAQVVLSYDFNCKRSVEIYLDA